MLRKRAAARKASRLMLSRLCLISFVLLTIAAAVICFFDDDIKPGLLLFVCAGFSLFVRIVLKMLFRALRPQTNKEKLKAEEDMALVSEHPYLYRYIYPDQFGGGL